MQLAVKMEAVERGGSKSFGNHRPLSLLLFKCLFCDDVGGH